APTEEVGSVSAGKPASAHSSVAPRPSLGGKSAPGSTASGVAVWGGTAVPPVGVTAELDGATSPGLPPAAGGSAGTTPPPLAGSCVGAPVDDGPVAPGDAPTPGIGGTESPPGSFQSTVSWFTPGS